MQAGQRAHCSRNSRRLLASVAALVMCAGACKPKAAPIASKKVVLPDSAEMMMFGANIVITKDGVSRGRLLSDTAYIYNDPSGLRYELQRVNVTFFTAQGADDGTMTARAGTYNYAQKRLEGRGNVIILRKDGNKLESPQLVYDDARNQIFSDSSFVYTQPNKRVLSGIGFESDPRLTNLRCIRNCKFSGAIRVPGA